MCVCCTQKQKQKRKRKRKLALGSVISFSIFFFFLYFSRRKILVPVVVGGLISRESSCSWLRGGKSAQVELMSFFF
jgi:hypothetical protein